MRIICYLIATILGYFACITNLAFANTAPKMPKTTIILQAPPPNTELYFQELFNNFTTLNAARVMPQLNPPTSSSSATYVGTSVGDSGSIIQQYAKNLPDSIKLFAYLYPKGDAWANFPQPKNAVTITCPPVSTFTSCAMGVKPAPTQDGVNKICKTIEYAIQLNNVLINNPNPGKVDKLSGIFYDHEGFAVGSACTKELKALIDTQVANYYKNNPPSKANANTTLKLAWTLGNGKPAISSVDISMTEIYDLAIPSCYQHLQCSVDNISPASAYKVPKDLTNCKKRPFYIPYCSNTFSSTQSFLFPGYQATPSANPVGDIYNCSITPNSPYCTILNTMIKPKPGASPDTTMISTYNFIFSRDFSNLNLSNNPTNNNYSTQFNPNNQTPSPTQCHNTVFLFSTQYYGKPGATQGCTSASSDCNCLLIRYSKGSTGSGANICSLENGFGAWNIKNNWTSSTSPYQAFINVVRNFVTAAIQPGTSHYPCDNEPTVGIWMYDFIPQDWLNSPSTPAAQKTNTTDANTGASTKK